MISHTVSLFLSGDETLVKDGKSEYGKGRFEKSANLVTYAK